jgi:hypothetical protein
LGTRNSGRQTEDALKTTALGAGTKADTAIDAAGTADPLEQQRRDYVKRILDWQEHPTSMSAFPDQTGPRQLQGREGRHGRGKSRQGLRDSLGRRQRSLLLIASPSSSARLDWCSSASLPTGRPGR